MGPFLQQIGGKAFIAQETGAGLEIEAFGVEPLQLRLFLSQRRLALVRQQQPAIPRQRVEREVEDQDRQGSGRDIGLKAREHCRLKWMVRTVDSAPMRLNER